MGPTAKNPRVSALAGMALAGLCIFIGVLVGLPNEAHALFATEMHERTYHPVKPFPVDMSVEVSDAEVRDKEIGDDRLTVTITYSDGSTRQVDRNEYEVTPAEIPAGFKGEFEGEVTFQEDGHETAAEVAFEVDAAYGAQYGHSLVFGRGIPAEAYDDQALTSTTWGIEEPGCSIQWSRSQLTEVIDIDTVAPQTMASWFTGATSLRTVSLTRMDTSHAVSFADLFYGCTALKTLEGVSEWDTSSVTNCQNAFRNTFALVRIDLSRWNVGRCTNFFNMFGMYPEGASNLVSVGDLSGWNMSSATTIDCMFQRCNKLTSVGNIGKWNTSNITSMGDVFQSNHALTYVGDLAGWDVSRVWNMRETFQGCHVLTSIGNVSGWNTSNVTTMYQMFQWCAKLTVNCRSWNVKKVTDHKDFAGETSGGISQPSW